MDADMFDVTAGGHQFELTELHAKSLLRALSAVLGEPKICGVRGMCALYQQNVASAYGDNERPDETITVVRREE